MIKLHAIALFCPSFRFDFEIRFIYDNTFLKGWTPSNFSF